MKIILLFSIAVMALSCSKKNEKKNDLMLLGLKGDVKSVTEIYRVIDYSGNQTEYNDKIDSFNIAGFNTYKQNYWKGEHTYRAKYDINNNKIELSVTHADNWSESKCTIKNSFNSNNELVEQKEYNNDTGELTYYHKFKYDEKGNLILDNDYLESKNLEYKYEYNENDSIVKKFTKDKNIFKLTFKNEFDENGNKISKQEFGFGDDFNPITKFRYDENNFLIWEYREFDMETTGFPLTITYKNDKKGNWIERTIKDKDFNISISKRIIKYFSDKETQNVNIHEDSQTETKEVKSDIENDNLKSLKEIQLTLMDASLKKALELGYEEARETLKEICK